MHTEPSPEQIAGTSSQSESEIGPELLDEAPELLPPPRPVDSAELEVLRGLDVPELLTVFVLEVRMLRCELAPLTGLARDFGAMTDPENMGGMTKMMLGLLGRG